MAFFLLIISWF